MIVVPITLREARAFVAAHHRHHAPQGGLFALGAAEGERVVGVAIVGRPVARALEAAVAGRGRVAPGSTPTRPRASCAGRLLVSRT
jgi:hypothetical protein